MEGEREGLRKERRKREKEGREEVGRGGVRKGGDETFMCMKEEKDANHEIIAIIYKT